MASSAGVVGLLRVILALETANFEAGSKRATDQAKKLERDLTKIGTQATDVGKMLSIGLTVPLVGMAAASLKAAADFELAFANIRKTVGQVGASAQESAAYYKDLEGFLRSTAREIPKTTEELARIAALGGQFGISASGLKIFTRTIAELDIAVSDMTGEEAATGLAQLRNITRSSEADISKMASALVVLGNNGASTEGHILELSKRIAGAGSLIGLTTPQIMGISAAIANVGVNAEAGGTAFSRTLSQMSASVDTGGEKLEAFARIAGLSADEFSQVFRTKPVEAVELFIKGLARTKDAGENLTLILGDIGSEGVRQADTLKRLTLAHEDVSRQLKIAGDAYQANDGHTKAAEEKAKTFWNQLVLLKNEVKDVAITIGNEMIPILLGFVRAGRPLIDAVAVMVNMFASLPGPVKLFAFALAGIAAAAGPTIYGLGQIALSASTLAGLFTKGGIAARVLTAAFPGISHGAAAAAVGVTALKVALAGLGIGIVVTGISLLVDHLRNFRSELDQLPKPARQVTDAAGNVVMTLEEAQAAARKAGTGLQELGIPITLAADAMTRFGKNAKGAIPAAQTFSAELAATKAKVASLTSEQWKQIQAGVDLKKSTKEITDRLNELYPALKMTEQATEKATQKLKDDAKAALEAAAARREFAESVTFQPITIDGVNVLPPDIGADSSAEIAEIRNEMEAMASITPLGGMWDGFKQGITDSGVELSKLQRRLALMASLKQDIGQIFQNIPQAFAQSLLQGGGIGNAVKSLTSQLGSGLAKWGAAALGFTGPWGQAIAGAAGALLPMVAKLWGGPSEAVKQARQEIDKFQQGLHAALTTTQRAEAGNERWKMTVIAVRDAYLATGRTAAEAERIVQQLWDTDNPERAKAAMEEINRVMREQAEILAENKSQAQSLFDEIMTAGAEGIPAAYRPAIEQLIALGLLTDEQAAKLRGLADATGVNVKKMEDALAIFEGRVESLGPAFAQAKINETAMKYVNAIQTMIDGSGDLGGILFDAKEELGELVAEALRSGKALPANLKPWIEDLIKSGNLVDKNGKKITDISELKWGDPIKTEAEKAKEGWDKILAAIERLIEKITGPLEEGMDRATRDRSINVDVNYRERGTDDGRNKGEPEGDRTGFAFGTRGRLGDWFKNFPQAGYPTMLHGKQAVVRHDQRVPFSMAVLREMLPSMPTGLPSFGAGSVAPVLAAAGAAAGPASPAAAAPTNNFVMIGVPKDAAGDAYAIARSVVTQLPQAIAMDEGGLRSSLERVIKDWMRTYG